MNIRMKIKTGLFLLMGCTIFAQKNQTSAEKKITEYIIACQNVIELKKIEIFEKDFPNIFKFYPNINPINPKNKPGISSGFSNKRLHPLEGKLKVHNGVDIVARKNTPVYAAADGVVKKSKFFNGKAGHSVEIMHKFGFATRYFHLSIFIVKKGEKVRKGQIIGFLGTTGASTGPHLHYEMLKNGIHMNPISFLSRKG
jgi:murein DD-endopeptidase MepM/ murein hydrolase activator NlpD